MQDTSKLTSSHPLNPRQWDEALKLVRRLEDSQGMRVDPEIEQLVTALRLLGYKTVMSCGGHLDRRTTGPYVVIRSQATGELVDHAEREVDESKKQQWFREAQNLARQEVLGLKRHVDTVNERNDGTGRQSIMELRPSGHSSFRLCFVHADFDGQLDDTSYAEAIRSRRATIEILLTKLTSELGLELE
jgi:hypothetical protein